MDNNAMNIELLKAMRGVWIIQIETIEKGLVQYGFGELMLATGKLAAFRQCLQDLIDIIGE